MCVYVNDVFISDAEKASTDLSSHMIQYGHHSLPSIVIHSFILVQVCLEMSYHTANII